MSTLFIDLVLVVGCEALLLTAYLIVLAGYAIKGRLTGEGALNAMKPVLDEW
ncbi:MAG: hypothetical protein V7731_21140 [Amphritea sp.]